MCSSCPSPSDGKEKSSLAHDWDMMRNRLKHREKNRRTPNLQEELDHEGEDDCCCCCLPPPVSTHHLFISLSPTGSELQVSYQIQLGIER